MRGQLNIFAMTLLFEWPDVSKDWEICVFAFWLSLSQVDNLVFSDCQHHSLAQKN